MSRTDKRQSKRVTAATKNLVDMKIRVFTGAKQSKLTSDIKRWKG